MPSAGVDEDVCKFVYFEVYASLCLLVSGDTMKNVKKL